MPDLAGDALAGELLEIAVEVARGAAQLATETRAKAITEVSTKSTRTDVVTTGDQATERYVLDALHERRPGDSVLALYSLGGEAFSDAPSERIPGARLEPSPSDAGSRERARTR